MRLQRTSGTRRRRGIILLVVLVMLTLFAIAGLTFVLYAEATAESARFNKDAETTAAPDMDPNVAFNYFLGQLVYGLADPTAANPSGGESALRGHSLGENMYGGYDSLGNVPSDAPYNGTGRLHATYPIQPGDPPSLNGVDDATLVNCMYYASDGFLRDPSRYGTRANPSAGRSTYTGGQNPPYTYPDTNSMFLASINQTTGQVTMSSFHRPWLFGSGANNPNWTNAQGKYLTCIVRPADMGPGFPAVGAAGGPDPNTGCSVKNLVGAPGGPDSPWIDIGAPEMFTSSGLRYKMLVAPLIIDLDNRVNVNVHGNVFAKGGLHAGNQAWTTGEVNLSRVLNVGAAPNEWQNLFLGAGGMYGRYGQTGLPTSIYGLNGPTPHAYAPADLNGLNDPGQGGAFTPTQVWSLPGGANTQPFQCFPYFPTATSNPPGGYGNNLNGIETQSSSGQPNAHWMFFNPLNPGPGNRLLPLKSHAALMYGGADAANLDLARLCPNNFNSNDLTTIRRIHETTALSMDLDRFGAAPYVWDTTDAANPPNQPYTIFYNPTTGKYVNSGNPGDPANNGAQPQAFPPLASRNATPANSEFDPRTWRSGLPGGLATALSRIDLDRPLATYTGPNANPGQAVIDRQQFAVDIYTRLLAATGMTGVNANIAAATPQQYLTLRWLAQLSANVVDYIDTDDVMTEFIWTKTPQAGDTGIVFGTELPKLVLNEVYLEYTNDPLDKFPINPVTLKPAASLAYQMNAFAELVNPLTADNDNNGPNNAVLINGAGSQVYQILLTKPNALPSLYGPTYPQGMRRPENLLGDPDNTTQTSPQPPGSGNYTNPGQVLSAVTALAAGPQVVTPMNAATGPGGGNTGYYVVGPASDTTVKPVSFATPAAANTGTSLSYTVPLLDPTANNPVPPTLVLRRLANPNLGYQPDSTKGNYNPYITVDYVEMNNVPGSVNDARTNTDLMPVTPPTVDNRYSYGRTEPYAGITTGASPQIKKQPYNGSGNGQPSDTFFAMNSPAAAPANHWLVHMDRPLVSPIELAGVSAFKPHELTQQFISSTGTPYGHLAPWTDPNTRLYRLLDLVKVGSTTPGVMPGGRVPGRINLNTIDGSINPNTGLPNAPEVFRALCDAEQGNQFYVAGNQDQNVDALFTSLMQRRTPGGTPGSTAASSPNPTDQPFWPASLGASPGGDPMGTPARGINQTLLAAAANFTPGTNPYQQLELLNKIYNNTTTRSNVFAVWLTVGFFQVTDDTTTPIKLGPEINSATGKSIRHQIFAIIDRTQLTTFNTSVGGNAVVGPGSVAPGIPATVTDPRTGLTWQTSQPGTTLVYDPGAFHLVPPNAPPDPNNPYNLTPAPDQSNEETVVVQANGTVNLLYPHPPGTPVISRGNPGPWTKYDPSQDGQVVPYLQIIY